MSCSGTSRPVAIGWLILCLTGCGRAPAPPGVRVTAVLPFQNLTSDSGLDWLSAGAPLVLENQLAGSRAVRLVRVRNLSDAYAAGAYRVVHGYFSGAVPALSLHIDFEDLDRVQVAQSRDASGAVFPLLDGVAKVLDPAAPPYASASLEALRAFAESQRSTDPEVAAPMLEKALVADPNYGPAWVALAQRLAGAGASGRAAEVAARGLSHKLADSDRIRLQALTATLSGDDAARAKALSSLADASPMDVNLLVGVAETAFRDGRYADAVKVYQQAAAAEPTRTTTWNLLAYAQAYQGDFDAAVKSIARYRELAPQDPNGLDSLGDIHFLFGRFAEAEKYYLEVTAADPSFLGAGPLGKAAEARWMANDLAGADQLEQRFLDARKKLADPLVVYRQAQWNYMTGRGREAIAALEAAVPTFKGDTLALVRAELSAWKMDAGDAVAARRLANDSAGAAANPQIAVLVLMAQAASGAMPAAVPPAFRDQVTAWGLLFHQRFADAEPLLARLQKQAAPEAASRTALLRAWALVRAGQVKEAAPLVERYPVPASTGEPPFSAMILPRWFFVKAMVLRDQGKTAEAEENLRRYRQYAGDGAFAKGDLTLVGTTVN
ncbi:MAG: tetratricopeptide repeat protein [Bryobacteraceae bacterium]